MKSFFRGLKAARTRWNEIASEIGIIFLKIWHRKHVVFPILIAVSALAWVYHYSTLTLVSLHVALVPTIILLALTFIGLIVVEHIEGLKDASEIPTVITQTLVALGAVLATLLYLSGMLFRVFPAPPLPFLLAILIATRVAPYSTVLVLIPPLIGHVPKIRPKWVELRRKYPFWAVYLGVLAGLLTLSVVVVFPEMLLIGRGGIMIFLMGSSIIICSCLLVAAAGKLPVETVDFATSVLGFVMVLLGILLWLGALGGFFFGSVFAILGGAHAHSWKPNARSLKAEKNPRKGGRAARW